MATMDGFMLYQFAQAGLRDPESFSDDEKTRVRDYMVSSGYKPPAQVEQDNTWENTMATRDARKISDGMDPALRIAAPTIGGLSNFKQFDAAQSADIAAKAAQFDEAQKPGPLMSKAFELVGIDPATVQSQLNPYIPEEAAQLAARKQSYYNSPEADDSKLTSFMKLLDNERQKTMLMDTPEGIPEITTGNGLADTAAGFLGFGAGLISPNGAAGAMTSAASGALKMGKLALTPIAPQLAALGGKGLLGKTAARGIEGALGGAGYGAVEGTTQGMNAQDTLKTMGEQALMFGGMEAGLPLIAKGLGKVGGDFMKYGGQALDETAGGELLGPGKMSKAAKDMEDAEYKRTVSEVRPALMYLEDPEFLRKYDPESYQRFTVKPVYEKIDEMADAVIKGPEPEFAPKTWTEAYEAVKPDIEGKLLTVPQESRRALVDFLDGQLGASRSELGHMKYKDLLDLANDLVAERKTDLNGLVQKAGTDRGWDMDLLYKTETDSKYATDRARLAEVSGVTDSQLIDGITTGETKPNPVKLEEVPEGAREINDPVEVPEGGWAPIVGKVSKYATIVTDEVSGATKLVGSNGTEIHLKATREANAPSSWDKDNRALTLQLNDADGRFEFNHELSHAMRDLGMVADKEWDMVLPLARQTLGDVDALVQRYADKGHPLGSQEDIDHEVVAKAVQIWMRDGVPGQAKGFMGKVQSFLRDAGQALGLVQRNATDVARDLTAGKHLSHPQEGVFGKVANNSSGGLDISANKESSVMRDTVRHAFRLDDHEFEYPALSSALMMKGPLTDKIISNWAKAAKAAGVSKEAVAAAQKQMKLYNKIAATGEAVWIPHPESSGQVVLREGVLNTAPTEGLRRNRMKMIEDGITSGKKVVVVPDLNQPGTVKAVTIPGGKKNIRGMKASPFLNLPVTAKELGRKKPADMDLPLVVTGNPHVTNFKRPDPSWDGNIKVVRIKPVANGSEAATKAVVDAINYANEIGARILVTTFRAKQPWVLAKFLKEGTIPMDPKDPAFSKYWKENPAPKPADPRLAPDYVPYIQKGSNVSNLLRENGWDIQKNLYGEGGTWWWPKTKSLDDAILKKVDPNTQLEYCDLLNKGCTSCRNCQKLTYPEAAGDPIVGITDEPFCDHKCPQCFVRMGQSGVGGRGNISLGQNAKQAGFGEADLGDTFHNSVNIIQEVLRPANRSGSVDYVRKFLRVGDADKLDIAMNMYIRDEISLDQLRLMQAEISGGKVPEAKLKTEPKTTEEFMEQEPPMRYAIREGEPPKKTEIAYKLMRIDAKGNLKPLFVRSTEIVPQGVWLRAEAGEKAAPGVTGVERVKSTLGDLSYRPGWHLGDIPMATHIGKKELLGINPKTGKNMYSKDIRYQKPKTVWVECEYSVDVDYSSKTGPNGLQQIPENGFYRHKTNEAMTGDWIIAGDMKLNRVLTDTEAADIIAKYNGKNAGKEGFAPLAQLPRHPTDVHPGAKRGLRYSLRSEEPDVAHIVYAKDVVAAREAQANAGKGKQPTNTVKTWDRWETRAEAARKALDDGAAILDKNGKAIGSHPVKTEKKVYLVMGPPGAGKSSVLVKELRRQFGCREIDSDNVKQHLPEFEGGQNAGLVHEESSDITKRMLLPEAISRGENIALPIVGKGMKSLEEYVSLFEQAGYKVHVRLVDIPPEEAASRALWRFQHENRFVDPRYILDEVGTKPRENYKALMTKRGDLDYEAYANDTPIDQPARRIDAEIEGELAKEHGYTGVGPQQAAGRGGGPGNLGGAPANSGGPRYSLRTEEAKEHFGVTHDWKEAGYLTPDGKLLDFSGKREGGPSGVRYMDHREISDIYPPEEVPGHSDGLIKFLDEGNIRLMQGYGFELTQLPTAEQERMLARYITQEKGEVAVDLSQIGKHSSKPLFAQYPKGTNAAKIINDIRKFYETGEAPKVSDVSKFRYALPDPSWNKTTTKTNRERTGAVAGTRKVYSAMVDNLLGIKRLSDKAYKASLHSRESSAIARNCVMNGIADIDGNSVGPSLKSIYKKIPKKAVADFESYLTYKHAPTWIDQGRKVFPAENGVEITSDVCRQRAAAYEQAHPEFAKIGKEIVNWQKQLGQTWLVDTGIITQKSWDAMNAQYPDYIPLQRQFSALEKSGGYGTKGFNAGDPIKKGTGSERPIISPLESIIEHTDQYVKIAKKNRVLQILYGEMKRDTESFKDLLEIMPEKGETFESAIEKDGMQGFIDWMAETPEAAAARKGQRYDRDNVIRGRINGQSVHFKVSDPIVLESLANLSDTGTVQAVEWFRQATRVMKLLTTGANPIFASRNIARDVPMAYINSKTLTNVPVVRELEFAWGLADSLARIVTNGKYDPGGHYKSFKAMGGGAHSSAMAGDRNLLAEAKSGVLGSKGAWGTTKMAGRGIEAFTNAVETLPRLPEYIRTVEKGGTRQEGFYQAKDITVNFDKYGNIAKQADAFIPYFNASMQGLDKIARTFKENPAAASYRSMVSITLPAALLWSINHDDPNYKKLSSWVKDNYYCIPREDGTFVKVAKPREVGVLFGSLVERALNKMVDNDPHAMRYFAESVRTNFIPPVRPIFAPLYDVAANKNFAGAPIVPGYMQKLSPELQADESTSLPAKMIGKATGSSPKKLDYLLRSYTGVVGELGIPAASEGRGENVAQRVGNVAKKSFTADPLYSNDTMRAFYDKLTELETAKADSKVSGQNANGGLLTMMNRSADTIGDINKMIRTVNADKNLSYEEKDAKVRALKQKALLVAQGTMTSVEKTQK